MNHRLVLAFSAVCASLTSLLAAEKKSPEARLQQLFKAHPNADANKDGKLTVEEAKAHMDANSAATQKTKSRKIRKADEANEGVSAEVLAVFEGRESEGMKYRLLKPIDLGGESRQEVSDDPLAARCCRSRKRQREEPDRMGHDPGGRDRKSVV